VEEPKKPALGDVRLSTPVINQGKAGSTPGESEPSIDVSASANNASPLSELSTSHRNEPAAPIPIGGDVKPAKLIKSVPPAYPPMAKTQHVSGNVQIDALIDADGNVGAMKVLSGPALLRDAAVQSLKQWKYQPAELDGKPTSMHLTVTLQFRAQ
jgi:protein TonB